jgi:hypothetical protein
MVLELPHLISQAGHQVFAYDISTTTAKSVAGMIIAAFEVLIITPTERLKVWLMTKEADNKNIRYFFRNSHKLFCGLNIVFWKQNVSWVTFLGTDELLKNVIRRHKNLKNTEMLSFSELMQISLILGGVNTAFVMPLDFLKTRVQRDGSHEPQKGRQLIKLAQRIYKEQGLNIFYSGWKVRLFHFCLQSILTVKLYDMLETGYRKMVKSKV